VLIYERAGTPCGVVLFNDHDPVAGTAEWGFFLTSTDCRNATSCSPWLELEKSRRVRPTS
jgi:hypothetical protein